MATGGRQREGPGAKSAGKAEAGEGGGAGSAMLRGRGACPGRASERANNPHEKLFQEKCPKLECTMFQKNMHSADANQTQWRARTQRFNPHANDQSISTITKPS